MSDTTTQDAPLLSRFTKTFQTDIVFMEVVLTLDPILEFTEYSIKNILMSLVKEMFGTVGTAVELNIIKADPQSKRVIFSVPKKSVVGVWGALTFGSTYDSKLCRIQVVQASPSLSSLSANSRSFAFPPVQ